jgi:predicted ATPase
VSGSNHADNAAAGEANMRGAAFVRADLHVHTYADSDASPQPDLAGYVSAAIENEIDVLAITDHNSTRFVEEALTAATSTELTVLPGIEISTRAGHLLGLFDPDRFEELEAFATAENLRLKKLSDIERRSERSLIELIEEIGERGGLAIPAHIDATKGMVGQMSQDEMTGVLTSPHLAGLEFTTREALEQWFTDADPDTNRLAAWKARQRKRELAARGLARLMSSDAHSAEKVGRDRASRTLTRLRLDDPNFAAIRNAIQLNPKARCKAEVTLPASYPQILSAAFEGGFLDGVRLEFSPNLNCLIGGRGSGKSTALLAIRAALGASTPSGEDPDDEERMPEKTTVVFVDNAGSERVAIRERGSTPVTPEGAPIHLRLADLGQDESGRLARGYRDEPLALLSFLDGFLVKHELIEQEEVVLAELAENGTEVVRTAGTTKKINSLEIQQKQQEDTLRAAEQGKIEEIARYALLLSTQGPLLKRLDTLVEAASKGEVKRVHIDLDSLATEYKADLSEGPAKEFVDGEDGLRALLSRFQAESERIATDTATGIGGAASDLHKRLEAWQQRQGELEQRLEAKREELKEKGLEIQAGAILNISKRLNQIKTQLVAERKRSKEHTEALAGRGALLQQLNGLRDRLYQLRKKKLGDIAAAANANTDGLRIHVIFDKAGVDAEWRTWLSRQFSLREPRVTRAAEMISPARFADLLQSDPQALAASKEPNGEEPFELEKIEALARDWDTIFELQTMRLEDRPRIEVQRGTSPKPHPFDHLSAGQQRSVLLSLMLCAERSEPLVLDQPEDHLDGQYIASTVVGHLEAAKERRQVLIATHSPNLVVLGDAELVVPMRLEDDHGRPYEPGGVDRPATREQVCALLEGGREAYRRRGERYGFGFNFEPPPLDDATEP